MVTNDNQPRLTITNHHEALTSTIIIFQRRELGVHSTILDPGDLGIPGPGFLGTQTDDISKSRGS
jgi:hypothetical protein